MRARFGRNTHIVFCCFALIINIAITVSILLAGRATIGSLVKDTSDEFTLCVMAVLFGSYCLIGGLGTTFYVSYFNACLVFILLVVFVVKIWHNTDDDHLNTGNTKDMFDTLSCLKGPDENFNSSFITFRSGVGLLYGLIEVTWLFTLVYNFLFCSFFLFHSAGFRSFVLFHSVVFCFVLFLMTVSLLLTTYFYSVTFCLVVYFCHFLSFSSHSDPFHTFILSVFHSFRTNLVHGKGQVK